MLKKPAKSQPSAPVNHPWIVWNQDFTIDCMIEEPDLKQIAQFLHNNGIDIWLSDQDVIDNGYGGANIISNPPIYWPHNKLHDSERNCSDLDNALFFNDGIKFRNHVDQLLFMTVFAGFVVNEDCT